MGALGALPGVRPPRNGPKTGPGPRGPNWVTQGVAPFVIVSRGGRGPQHSDIIYKKIGIPVVPERLKEEEEEEEGEEERGGGD